MSSLLSKLAKEDWGPNDVPLTLSSTAADFQRELIAKNASLAIEREILRPSLVPVSTEPDYNYYQYIPPFEDWWNKTISMTLTTKEDTMTSRAPIETVALEVHSTARIFVRIPEFAGESANTRAQMRENYIEEALLRLRSNLFDYVEKLNDQYTVAAISVDSEVADEDVFARTSECE